MKRISEQLALPIDVTQDSSLSYLPYKERLINLLECDLDFHDKGSNYASHNFHSFPAKFPPQLPQKFIDNLTLPGDIVLDPMMGSGTTILEAFLSQRQAIGFDIDPLALMIGEVKITPLNLEKTDNCFHKVMAEAKSNFETRRNSLEKELTTRWDSQTKEFLDYWFDHETQLELLAILIQIEAIKDHDINLFLKLAFSSSIITKSGGVSLALDLAHTRPHRAKVIRDRNGHEIFQEKSEKPIKHLDILTKTLRSPFTEFEKRYRNNIKGVSPYSIKTCRPVIAWGDAQALSLPNSSVDLIVTSPPYATNAIDYMRAHKFSLVWFGFPIDELSKKRQDYIGGENTTGLDLIELPETAMKIVNQLSARDAKKGIALHRYYSEMTRVLKEMYRVLKPGRASILVVGNSIMRSMDTETQNCLSAIGIQLGFSVPAIGIRKLDRDRRMLPASTKRDLTSQIQQRMHEEYVIGFYKPD